MRTLRATAGLTAIAATVAAGCGSSPLSAADLRQQAGEICTKADRQIGRISTPSSDAAGNSFIKQGIAVLDPELAQLKGLVPPADESSVYRSAIRALSGELDSLHAAATQLDRGADPVKAFKALQARLAPQETDADSAWRALGIPACLSR